MGSQPRRAIRQYHARRTVCRFSAFFTLWWIFDYYVAIDGGEIADLL